MIYAILALLGAAGIGGVIAYVQRAQAEARTLRAQEKLGEALLKLESARKDFEKASEDYEKIRNATDSPADRTSDKRNS